MSRRLLFLQTLLGVFAMYSLMEMSCRDSTTHGKFDPCSVGVGADGGETANASWSGFNVDLLDAMATMGKFTYEIVSMGSDVDIGKTEAERSNPFTGYTHIANRMVAEHNVILFGQSTWNVNLPRLEGGFSWSVPVLSDDVLFLTTCTPREDSSPPKTYQQMFLFMKPFNINAWLAILASVVLYGIILYVVCRDIFLVLLLLLLLLLCVQGSVPPPLHRPMMAAAYLPCICISSILIHDAI